MATLIDDGWLYLSNGSDTMKIACIEISYDHIRDGEANHYEGGINFGYDMNLNYFMIKVSGMVFKTKAAVEIFKDKFNSWLTSAPITLRIQDNTAPTYEKFDGTNTTLTVISPKGYSGYKKIAHENGTVWVIDKCGFEEAGARAA